MAIWTGSLSPQARRSASPSGRSVAHCNALSSKPTDAKISRAPSICIAAPEWLDCASANKRGSKTNPLRTIADAWAHLTVERGKILVSISPSDLKIEPSAFNTARNPRCSDSTTPSRTYSAKTASLNINRSVFLAMTRYVLAVLVLLLPCHKQRRVRLQPNHINARRL